MLDVVGIFVIVLFGVGCFEYFINVFNVIKCSVAFVVGIFYREEVLVSEVKAYMILNGLLMCV